jgi:hypothetical protein
MAVLVLQKENKNQVMVLMEQSVETPRSPSMAARSLAGPTSRRLCRRADLKEASNQQCPVSEDTQQGLERCVDYVVAEVAMSGFGRR